MWWEPIWPTSYSHLSSRCLVKELSSSTCPSSPDSHQGLAGACERLQTESLPGWLRCPKLSSQDLSLKLLKDSCVLPWGKELSTSDFCSHQSGCVNSVSQAKIPFCPKKTLSLHLHWLSSLTLHPLVLCKARVKATKPTLIQRVLSKYQREKNIILYKFYFNLYFNGHLQQIIKMFQFIF